MKSIAVSIVAGVGALFFQGCSNSVTDPCKEPKTLPSGSNFVADQVRAELQRPRLAVRGAAAAPLASTVTPKVQPERLAFIATKDTPNYFQTFPCTTVGKFIAQSTVAFAVEDPVKGLIDNQSRVGLEFEQIEFKPNTRRYYFVAIYNSAISGYTAALTSFTGIVSGTPFNIPNTSQVDLRIEQDDTKLVFSARATPLNQSAGGWTTVYTENGAPDPAPLKIYLGMRQTLKGAAAYFNNLAMDGDGVGGFAEHAIVSDFRSSVEAIRSAEDKITAADLVGAAADLDTAIAANDAARAKIQLALVDRALKRAGGAILALKASNVIAKDLATARAAVPALDSKKTKTQLAKLESVQGAELAAIANIFGLKTKNLSSLPDIFFLHVP